MTHSITERELAIFRLAYSYGAGEESLVPEEWAAEALDREASRLPKDTREEEIARWRNIALYAADLHAATAALYAADVPSATAVPASRKERLFSICRKLADMILGTDVPPVRFCRETPEEEILRIVERLRIAERLREAETFRY